MSIFDVLKNAIFGHAATATPARAPGAVPPSTPASSTAPAASRSSTAPAAPSTPPTPAAPIDIEAVLDQLNTKQTQKLNWRTSIVDLMKLVGIDSSLEHRKALAKELGYTGDPNDSASMNVWLHKEVMKKLAANGGKVPADLQ